YKGNLTVNDYLALDESVILFYFQRWCEEEDDILSDLCIRFMDRKLFKYVAFDQETRKEDMEELAKLFKQAGIDPDYYLVLDSSSDLPYDVYRTGNVDSRIPIYLQMPNKALKE